ncbi:MAG: CPBP family glutamic-type intramembrane protease [Cyanobacteria bacterium P01_E01_bin.42]
MNGFINAARQGKNQWWRYLLGISLILFSWLIIGGLLYGISLFFALVIPIVIQNPFGSDLPDDVVDLQGIVERIPAAIAYFLANIPSLFFFLSLLFVVCVIHRRHFLTLIRGDRSSRWQRFWQGFGLWFVLLSGINFIAYFLDPGSFEINLNPITWCLFVIPAFFVVLLQSGTEELFFRGYLLQGLGLLIQNKTILAVLTGIIFAIPHFLNPEMLRNPLILSLTYLSLGFFLGLLVVKDNGLELALGQHAANNFVIVTLFNTKDSVLVSPAIFLSDSSHPGTGLIVYWVEFAIFYYLLLGRKQKQSKPQLPDR